MRTVVMSFVCAIVFGSAAFAATAASTTMADFESAASAGFTVSESEAGSVKADLAEAPGGRCLAVKFTRKEKSGTAYVYLPVTQELSRTAEAYDGISFKVKGDGSKAFGLIEIRTNDFTRIYQAVFRVDETSWKSIGIRWDEFFRIDDKGGDGPIDWKAINKFGFGSRAGWGSCSFEVDDLALAKIAPRAKLRAVEGSERLAKTVAKLKEGKAVKIVALGDSITFGTKVPKELRKTGLYFQIAASGIGKAFPKATVTTVNAGVGGDSVAEGLVRIGHQVAAEDPDLVTVLLGANDALYDFPDTRVRSTMSLLIDNLLETTKAEILVLGPTPVSSMPNVPERYCDVYKELATEKNVACFDLNAAMRRLPAQKMKEAFADEVHPSEEGHRGCGQALLEYVLGLAKD